MNTRIRNRMVSLLICLVMLVGIMPATVMAEHTPIAPAVDSTTTEYSVPSGSTLTIETYEHGFDSNFGLGKDYLFVIKKDGKYYAMQEMPVSEEPFDTIAAVEVTDWIAADGKSVTIPADPGNVAFIRYEDVNPSFYEMDLVERVNGNACLGYSMTRVWDEGYDNILSETMRFTAQSADASGSSMLWQTTPDKDSGTFYQYSRRSINYKSYYVDYAVDLREDGNGGYEFYWRTINDEALEYDAWQTQQEQGFGVEGYLFSGACRHQSKIDHAAYDAPTCMDKGCAEYWFCHGCERYFKDAALTQLHKAYLTPDGYFEPILAATGHDWGTNGCNNCGLATPVYTKITTMEQLSALGDNASFILVAQYGGKTYVLDGGDPEALAKRIDANGDMYEDIIEIDNNNNGTPDCLEIDEDSNGVWDYLETDLVNNDGIVDWYDYQNYWYDMDFGGLFDDVYSANAYEGGIMGAMEVTPHADGTITLSNDHILCFELTQMLSDEDIEMNLGFELEYNPDMTEEEQEAYRQNLQNNLMMKLPNLWLQPYFCWTNRVYMEDRPMYGDQTMWRFYFYDDIKDKTIEVEEYDYDLGDYVIKEVSVLPEDFETTAFSLSEGSVLIYSTHDMYGGLQNARENLHNSIRLRDVDDTIDFVGGSSVMDPETYEYIELNGGTQVSIYLYASDVAPAHTCDFGDWVDDEVTETHTRTCKDATCGKTETKNHSWDSGVQNGTPSCTEGAEIVYTCTGCGKTKSEAVDNLGHDWSDWKDDGANATTDTHSHTCNRNCGVAAESEPHSWGNWTPDGDTNHKKTCSVCGGTRTATHSWNEGIITTQPTEEEEGVKTYTCSDCGHTKTEPVDKLEHVHSWSDWGQNDENTHIRSCRCNETQTAGHNFDDGVVINWATHLAPGEIHYTCADCGYVKIGTQPALEEHEWSDWSYNNDDKTHTRSCICNATETKDCSWDAGVVTKQPTHYEEGIKTYTCSVCSGTKTEAIAKTAEHEWSDWSDNKDGTHTRSCRCNANETKDCTYDAGVVTTPSTHYEEGVKTFTCTVCGHTKTEAIAKTAEHEWSDWSDNKDGTHTRSCRCNANETLAHTWGNWAVQNDGGYKRECADCGAFETMTLPENKPVNTTTKDTAANTNLTNTDIELIENVLTDEEQSQVAEGAEVKVYLKVEDTLLLGLSFVILYPLIYMISVSIRDPGDMYDPSIVWIPRNLTLENFVDAIRCMDYGNAFLSSLLIGGVSSVFQIISCSLTAYGFARFKFKGRGFMFAMVILTILVPTQVIILPMYLMFQNLSIPFVGEALRLFMDISLPSVNLLDNPLMFYLQAAFGMGIRSGLYIFLLRQFYRGLPLELEEAAEIDGCNPLATFIRIIIPNSGTMLLTVSLFSLVWYWNDYYSTGIFLNENKTLAIALTGLRTELAADSGVVVNIFESTTQMQAGCILFMLPILVIYLVAQKYFTEGIERSGLVG